MFITGVGTALPRYQYSQQECWEAFCQSPCLSRLSSRSQSILKKVLTGENGIEKRHFAMQDLEEAFALEPDKLHQRFAENAPILAAEAAAQALRQRGLEADQVDALLICTCTGYLCPGLTSYVSERLGLRSDALLFDLVGQGCGAALPLMNMGSALIQSGQARTVVAIAVEVCSAAFYVDNNVGVLVSACLFADGAGAVILEKEHPRDLRKIKWTNFATMLNAKDRDLLRFETRGGMLRNLLDKSVPLLVVEQLREVLQRLEESSGLSQQSFTGWMLHAGGRDVLAAVQRGLDISAEELRWSADVLRQCGNISSPCVLFVLDKALAAQAPGGRWLLSAFGAGISCHAASLEVA